MDEKRTVRKQLPPFGARNLSDVEPIPSKLVITQVRPDVKWKTISTNKFHLIKLSSKKGFWIERIDGEGTELSVDQLNEGLEKMFNEVM